MNLDSRYGEYVNYFGMPLILKKSMYGMTNYGILFADVLANWMIDESVFNHSQWQLSIYYKYATYRFNSVFLSYVDYYVYWYNS